MSLFNMFKILPDVVFRIKQLLVRDTLTVRWVIGWIAFLLGFGFLTVEQTHINCTYIVLLMSKEWWAISFLMYGLLTVSTCLCRVNKFIQVFISVCGMWLWSYLFISLVVLGAGPIAAVDFTLVVPLITEVWILADKLFNFKNIIHLERRNKRCSQQI